VFEDKALADEAVKAVEKEVNGNHHEDDEKNTTTTIERPV
jgi:hypothetical protein